MAQAKEQVYGAGGREPQKFVACDELVHMDARAKGEEVGIHYGVFVLEGLCHGIECKSSLSPGNGPCAAG